MCFKNEKWHNVCSLLNPLKLGSNISHSGAVTSHEEPEAAEPQVESDDTSEDTDDETQVI